MPAIVDGPASALFRPLRYTGNVARDSLSGAGLSPQLLENLNFAPAGACVGWGIPFDADQLVVASGRPVDVTFEPFRAPWVALMHVTDLRPDRREPITMVSFADITLPLRSPAPLADHVADYEFLYRDGGSVKVAIRRRHQINPFTGLWGEDCFEAVTQSKPQQTRWGPSDEVPASMWGWTRGQTIAPNMIRMWVNYIWCWQNPEPRRELAGLRITPVGDAVLLFGASAGDIASLPTRWRPRRKALLRLPEGEAFDPSLADHGTRGLMIEQVVGGLRQIKLDLGQVIFAQPRLRYPNEQWESSNPAAAPEPVPGEVLVEYTSHEDAAFHFADGSSVPVREVERGAAPRLSAIDSARQRVWIRTVEAGSGREVPVRLHVHGPNDEYLHNTAEHLDTLGIVDEELSWLTRRVRAIRAGTP